MSGEPRRRGGYFLVLGCGVCSALLAQQAPSAADAELIQHAAAQPTPKRDGHPDLNGYWFIPGRTNLAPQVSQAVQVSADGKSVQLGIAAPQDVLRSEIDPVARRRADTGSRPLYKPEYVAKAMDNFDNANALDPGARCVPPGLPRVGPPAEISETRRVVYLMYATRNYYRVVPTDGRAHDPDADAMPMGDSVGHWDADTFVIDSVNFSDDTWLDRDGSFHTTHMRVTERYRRQGNTLHYDVTVEDPQIMRQPWILKPVVLVAGSAGQHVPQDYPCIEKDVGHYVNHNRH